MIEKRESFKLQLYTFSIIIIYILYFSTFLGVTYIDKSKIHLMSVTIETIICIILMLRFNPLKQHVMTDFDRAIIFSAASFLFINLFTTEIYSQYTNDINKVKDILFNNINNIL